MHQHLIELWVSMLWLVFQLFNGDIVIVALSTLLSFVISCSTDFDVCLVHWCVSSIQLVSGLEVHKLFFKVDSHCS